MRACRMSRAKILLFLAALTTFVTSVCYYFPWCVDDTDVVAVRRLDLAAGRCDAPPHSHVIYFMTPPVFGGNPLWYLGAEFSNPFASKGCSYSNCTITSSTACARRASLVVLHGPFAGECCNHTASGSAVRCTDGNARGFVDYELPPQTEENTFLFFQNEAPSRTRRDCLLPLDDFINYTWSYKGDSDIYKPLGGYFAARSTLAGANAKPTNSSNSLSSYHARVKNVLWYVSNCAGTKQAKARYNYAKELAQYIDVDIRGACTGRLDNCSKSDYRCLTKIREHYKFYLAFENSRCNEYVTEKFFDALKFGNVPVVMGARRADYEALAPPGSFVFADDFGGPRDLAEHLRWLSKSPRELAKHHAWRRTYQLKNQETVFSYVLHDTPEVCRLCELATLRPRKSVRISDWWGAKNNCRLE